MELVLHVFDTSLKKIIIFLKSILCMSNRFVLIMCFLLKLLKADKSHSLKVYFH